MLAGVRDITGAFFSSHCTFTLMHISLQGVQVMVIGIFITFIFETWIEVFIFMMSVYMVFKIVSSPVNGFGCGGYGLKRRVYSNFPKVYKAEAVEQNSEIESKNSTGSRTN